MKSAFDKIAAGLNDAIAYTNGDERRARVVRPIDVKAIRTASGMTQSQFAEAFRLPIGTLRDWEQGKSVPDQPARAYLKVIAHDPEGVRRALEAQPRSPR